MTRPTRLRTLAAAVSAALALSAAAAGNAVGGTHRSVTAHQGHAGHRAQSKPPTLLPLVTHPTDESISDLSGPTCATSKLCYAVGRSPTSYFNQLVEIDNGVPKAPITMGDDQTIAGVIGCTTKGRCVLSTHSDADGTTKLFLLHSGTMTPIPITNTTASTTLTALSAMACVSASTCRIVGTSVDKDDNQYGVVGTVTFKGSAAAATVAATGGTAAPLTSLDCVDAKFCVATGYNGQEGYVLRLIDGKPDGSRLIDTDIQVTGIECRSRTSCLASGLRGDGSGSTNFVGSVGRINPTTMQGNLNAVPGSTTSPGLSRISKGYDLATLVGDGGAGTGSYFFISAGATTGPQKQFADGTAISGIACPRPSLCIGGGYISDPDDPGASRGAVFLLPVKAAPSAPGLTLVSRHKTSLELRIHKPGDLGHSALKRYAVRVQRCKPHHKPCHRVTLRTRHLGKTASRFTVKRLSPGTTYFLSATATNGVGTSSRSRRVAASTR